jgi:hypothetical protein
MTNKQLLINIVLISLSMAVLEPSKQLSLTGCIIIASAVYYALKTIRTIRP